MRVTRRGLQISLGLIWLLDAALQFQPFMFSRQFATQVLAPVGPGNPSWIASPVHWSAQLTLHHRILMNALFATIQLLLALGILWRRTATWALLASLPWALGVWWLGEGLGGLFAGAQSPIFGSPGAVILYAVIAVLVLPGRSEDSGRSIAAASILGRRGSALPWLALWLGFIAEIWQAGNRSDNMTAAAIRGNGDGEPHWLATINVHVASTLAGHGDTLAAVLTVVFAFTAVAIFLPEFIAQSFLVVSIVTWLGVWVVVQDFGEFFTGSATDPNSALLLALLAVVFWPRTGWQPRRSIAQDSRTSEVTSSTGRSPEMVAVT